MWCDPYLPVMLDVQIEGAVEAFAQDFRQDWGLDADEPPDGMEWETWYEALSLEAAARELAAAALRLYRHKGLTRREINLPMQLAAAAESERRDLEEFLTTFKDLGGLEQDWSAVETYLRDRIPDPEGSKLRFFRTAIQIELADQARFLPSLDDVSSRLMTLVNYLIHVEDPRTRDQLKRVARCFLLNLVPEFCVMARTVVEKALERRLPAAYMRKVRGISSNERVPLSMWINEAAADNIFQISKRPLSGLQKQEDGQRTENRLKKLRLIRSSLTLSPF